MMEKKHQLIFGPGGNSDSFYAAGFKRTVDTFAWQRRFGLMAFEYSFGRGIRLSSAAAREIGDAAREAGVAVSVHAPYYINLASDLPENQVKSRNYILDSARMLTLMGGSRLVVHPGSPQKQRREDALKRCREALVEVREAMVAEGQAGVSLCLETMGRPSQIGSLEEIIDFVQLDPSFLPCVDFAHLHAASGGSLKNEADFEMVLNRLEEGLGLERVRNMHVHFSKIEYGPKGELRHRIFADEGFGPDFAHLAGHLVARGYAATIICESRGTMAEDAAEMLRIADAIKA